MDESITPLLLDKEIEEIRRQTKDGCTLQELREAVYQMYDVKGILDKKSVNMEIDQLLLYKRRIKLLPTSRLSPEEAFYVIAFLEDKNRLLDEEGIDGETAKKMGKRLIQTAKKAGKGIITTYPKMMLIKQRMDYWWENANKIR